MNKIACTILVVIFSLTLLPAQDKIKSQIENNVEALKELMINPNTAKFEALLSDQLTYGHSNGLIENKAQCIENFMSGTSDFVDITLSNQQSSFSGNTAWSRFDLYAHTNNKGVPGETRIKVLLIWVKEKNVWKLLARQAFKIPTQ